MSGQIFRYHTVLVQPRADTSDRRQTEGGGQGAYENALLFRLDRRFLCHLGGMSAGANHSCQAAPIAQKTLMRLIAIYSRSGEIEVVVFVVVIVIVFVVDSRPTATTTRDRSMIYPEAIYLVDEKRKRERGKGEERSPAGWTGA